MYTNFENQQALNYGWNCYLIYRTRNFNKIWKNVFFDGWLQYYAERRKRKI